MDSSLPKVITPYGDLSLFAYRTLESDEDQPIDAVARFGGELMFPVGDNKDQRVWASIRVKRIGNRWQSGGAVESGSVVDYTPPEEVGFMIFSGRPNVSEFDGNAAKDVLQAVAAALDAAHTAIKHVLSEPDGVIWRLSLQRQREDLIRQADSNGARAGDKPRFLNF